MLAYWIVMVLLGILICYSLIGAIRDYKSDKKMAKLISFIILLLVLSVIILNSLFKILDVGFEIPFVI